MCKIDDFQFFKFFEILYFFDHIVLQEKILKLSKALEVLYFGDDIIFKVERLEVYVFI